jgi:hypothetical protein
MADVPAWPSYEVGPEDSIFALGVVSVNFARFEYAFTWLFSVVSGLHEDFARITLARVGLLTCSQLLGSMIEKKDWPDGATELIRYFLKATKILVENRNTLLHSNLIQGWEKDATLYHVSRQGTMIQLQMSVDQIRQVADDLERYFIFAQTVANAVAVNVSQAAQREAGLFGPFPWPNKLPLPTPIQPLPPGPDRRNKSHGP